MAALFADLLEQRVRADGARPLLTCYPGDGQRTELSAVSYANWVAKTANLLDELGTAPGDAVALPVLRDHPASWMALAWVGACWTLGGTVVADDAAAARVVVTGPAPAPATQGRRTVIACSLHPMGLGFAAGVLPTGTIDWASEVRIQPDDYVGAPASPEDGAWRDAAGLRALRELTEGDGTSERVLVRADQPWATVRDGLLAPLLGGGSAVVVGAGLHPAERSRIVTTERVSVAPGS